MSGGCPDAHGKHCRAKFVYVGTALGSEDPTLGRVLLLLVDILTMKSPFFCRALVSPSTTCF